MIPGRTPVSPNPSSISAMSRAATSATLRRARSSAAGYLDGRPAGCPATEPHDRAMPRLRLLRLLAAGALLLLLIYGVNPQG
jgi:hypothetical protein